MAVLRVELNGLEMARGHDGPLRGAPEPVVLMAVYAVAAGKSALLGRELVAFAAKSRFPQFIRDGTSRRYEVPRAESFVVLMSALEEDTGEDIQRVYGAFEDASALRLWSHDIDDPEPRPLSTIGGDLWRVPRRCELEDDTGPFSSSCGEDKWVGAAAWVSGERHGPLDLRFHVRSEDRRNDWTILTSVRHD